MLLHVWTVDLHQPRSVVDTLAAHLDPHERRRADERRTGSPRDRYVVAHGAVREILAGVTGAAPGGVVIERHCRHCGDPAHGKPATKDPDLSFNLSHSGAAAVVAVARGAEVGIDIEEVRDRRHLDRLASRLLTPDEYEQWRGVEPAGRTIAFLRLWTAKEARLKAAGLGLTQPLRSVPAQADGWTVAPVDVGPTRVASVAARGDHVAPAVAPWVPGDGVTLNGRW